MAVVADVQVRNIIFIKNNKCKVKRVKQLKIVSDTRCDVLPVPQGQSGACEFCSAASVHLRNSVVCPSVHY